MGLRPTPREGKIYFVVVAAVAVVAFGINFGAGSPVVAGIWRCIAGVVFRMTGAVDEIVVEGVVAIRVNGGFGKIKFGFTGNDFGGMIGCGAGCEGFHVPFIAS